jgi:hypothetical protein
MNMARESTDLDRLIEEGLTLYGQGNLDGALLVWERVLLVDPDNAQANSYVDYVRMNYELLTSDLGDEDAGPFGIAADGEPEYQIEISPGEAPPVQPPLYMDPLDEGWYLGDDQGPPTRAQAQIDLDEAPVDTMTLELEADEPPDDAQPAGPGMTFDDATREYPGGHPPRSRTEPAALEFGPEATPGPEGFATQTTNVRRPDLGFVKPTREMAAAEPPVELAPPPIEVLELPDPRRKRATSAVPPELKMTLRTPPHGDDVVTAEVPAQPRAPVPPEPSDLPEAPEAPEPPEPDDASFELTYSNGSAADDDLISSLPSPRAHVTRDLPSAIVPPHQRAALDAIELEMPEDPRPSIHGAPTREIGIAFAATQTTDFSDKPTQELGRPSQLDPLISAPTRELGLRPAPVAGRALTEDQPTMAEARTAKLKPIAIEPDEERERPGTRSDIVLPFDPIDARSSMILDDVDRDAPAAEPKDDKTRRRISSLIDRALEWSDADQLDRAVAAVDLALSEDPNSALAQKLIHRNRETIMTVFQNFLGNLERQPSLARPLHELGSAPISPRAAFLLSRVDGTLTLDEILDVSGMPRLEAYRYLCQLFLRGILR